MRFARLASALALIAGGAAFAGAAPVSDGRYVMGTVLEITLPGVEASEGRAALDALFALAERLDALFTVYADDSAVSRLNRAAGAGPQKVPKEVAEILRDSIEGHRLSGGAFDVTIGPLVELWTRASERGALPDAAEIEGARARVGTERVQLHADGRAELGGGVSLNLGGIAKGWALDRMRPLLAERGIESALLNFGQSSTWAVGAPPGEAGWRLLVRGPGETLLGVVTLRDLALSVSGSLGQWVEIEGRRYGHVLDPRTGMPLTRRRQALVVAGGATRAEILSKALLVLGEREGLALVSAQPGCEGLLVDADGGVHETPGFRAAVQFEPLAGPASQEARASLR